MHDRKRHTAHCVASTRSCIQWGTSILGKRYSCPDWGEPLSWMEGTPVLARGYPYPGMGTHILTGQGLLISWPSNSSTPVLSCPRRGVLFPLTRPGTGLCTGPVTGLGIPPTQKDQGPVSSGKPPIDTQTGVKTLPSSIFRNANGKHLTFSW